MQDEVDKMDLVETYEMMNGMCEDERMRIKIIRDECQDTRYLPLKEERGMRCTELQHNHCMKIQLSHLFVL